MEWITSDDPETYLEGNYTGSTFDQLGSKSLILPSGARIVVYIFQLDQISTTDIGVTVSLIVFTANAQYHKETNIKAAS